MIDSHTGGEPTRVVISGGPDLGNGSMSERLACFRLRYDDFRSAVVNEPRGSDVIVGALLCEPSQPGAAAGVIFFNNVGYLGMCGHGTIGLMVTLSYLGRIESGPHLVETPVGAVTAVLHAGGEVTLENVPSYRFARQVAIEVEGYGRITGDVAWGGNWFFLVEARGVADHVELFGPPHSPGAGSKNFVLCPGKAYDRSPCGTGTSAKLACLAADGKLREGEIYRQESIVGSVFEGSYRKQGGRIVPVIKGSAWIDAEATLIVDPSDPFRMGIRR